jgi:hypothetical protein
MPVIAGLRGVTYSQRVPFLSQRPGDLLAHEDNADSMETRTVKPTSPRSATTEDVVLRDLQQVRLVFRPTFVKNETTTKATLKGTFVYQRKSRNHDWGDVPAVPLSSIKAGEDYRLELHSAELLELFNELTALYQLHDDAGGLPRGMTRYIKANQTVLALSQMTDEDFNAVMSGTESLGAPAVARLIRWASSADNFNLLFERLQKFDPNSLRNLNAALGLATLKRALLMWRQNRDNPSESFWQKLLANQAFVLEQIFSLPIVIIKERAYVGGTRISGKGGHLADFLFKNAVTNAVGLIEIKTPKTPLLGAEYRQGIYNASDDLTGAVQQILAYRQSLVDERDSILREHPGLDPFHPRCVVLIGHAVQQLGSDPKRKQAFELFRRELSDVEIITYDEMYARTQHLVRILEEGVAAPAVID